MDSRLRATSPVLVALACLALGGCDRASDQNGSGQGPSAPTSAAGASRPAPTVKPATPKKTMPHAPRPQPAADGFQTDGRFRVDLEVPARVGALIGNRPLGMSNPSEYCLEDGHLWQGSKFRLDDENLFGVVIDPALVGKTVIIYGTSKPSLDSMLVKGAACPPGYGDQESAMQMRSDWTSPECGFTIGRSTHEKLRALSYLDAQAVFPVTFIESATSADDGSFTVTVSNPLAAPIEGAEVVSHYEGGRGKPQPRYERQAITLQPGESKQVTVPRQLERELVDGQPRGRVFRLYDVALVGTAGQVAISAKVSAR